LEVHYALSNEPKMNIVRCPRPQPQGQGQGHNPQGQDQGQGQGLTSLSGTADTVIKRLNQFRRKPPLV